MIYALISDDGIILNRIELIDPGTWSAPDGQFIVSDPLGISEIGGAYTHGQFLPAPPPTPIVPTKVSARQIRLALRRIGLREQADALIAAAPPDIQDEWEYATEIRRDHPMWAIAAPALGKDDADIDQLFILAATL